MGKGWELSRLAVKLVHVLDTTKSIPQITPLTQDAVSFLPSQCCPLSCSKTFTVPSKTLATTVHNYAKLVFTHTIEETLKCPIHEATLLPATAASNNAASYVWCGVVCMCVACYLFDYSY